MTRWACAMPVLVLIWGSAVAGQQPAFRADVHTIPIYATVRGRDGRLVPSLTRDDFRVFVDGQPVALTQFSNDVQPITVAIMLDVGMGPRLARAMESAHRFTDALLPADTAAFGTFGSRVAVSPHLTSDHAVLYRLVEEEVWPEPIVTPPWIGIDRAISALGRRTGPRIVLVLSGGNEGGAVAPLRARAAGDDVMIYGVLFEGTMLDRLHKGSCPAGEHCTSPDGHTILHFNGAPPGTNLNPLAELTGGGHFTIKDRDDLAPMMTGVAEELRHQYVLGFTPRALDGKAHEIRVQAVPSGLTVRARKRYVAEAAR